MVTMRLPDMVIMKSLVVVLYYWILDRLLGRDPECDKGLMHSFTILRNSECSASIEIVQLRCDFLIRVVTMM